MIGKLSRHAELDSASRQKNKRSRITRPTEHSKSFGREFGMTNVRVWLWMAVIIYIIIQIFTLGMRGFDGDEGVILNVVQSNGWDEFWARIASDVHPPLYHALAKLSVSIFGVHEWSVRLPAAVAGGLLIFLGYWLGKKIWKGDKWKALVLGIFLGFAPYLFFFHGEARFYSLLLAGAVLTYGAIINLNKKQEKPVVDVRSWIIFLAGALILIWSQYLGWFILGAEFIFILVSKQWKIALWGIVIIILLIVSYLPFTSIALAQFSGRFSEQGGLLIADNITGILGAFYRFGAGRLVLGIGPSQILGGGWLKIALFVISLAVPLIIIFFGRDKSQKFSLWRTLGWTLAIISILMAVAVSEVGGRAVRYFVFLWPFYGALLVAGIWKLAKKWRGVVIVILLILLWSVALCKHIFVENRSAGEREVAVFLEENIGTGDAVLVKGALAGGEQAVVNFYYNGSATVTDYYGNYQPGALSQTKITVEDNINQLLDMYPRVWYYDFTYGILEEESINAEISENVIGEDKEEELITIYRIEK